MPLIPMIQMLHKVTQQFKSMPEKEAMEVKTYKKDRGFILYRKSADIFVLIGFGYENYQIENTQHEVSKELKKLIKREFPRSNRAWVQYFQNVDNSNNLRNKQPQMDLF